MSSGNIYVLHKNGTESHYIALKKLLENNNSTLKYREFSVFTKFFKALKTLDLQLFKKQLTNTFFLLSLFFTSNKKVVLGIAPYDYQLNFLLKALKNHHIYYHTSWTCWDKTFYPKRKKINTQVFDNWKYFIEVKAKVIFCVTKATKNEILKNYDVPEKKLKVVYHSIDPSFNKPLVTVRKKNSFIYVGRLIEQKGISEILEFFKNNSALIITIIGSGKEINIVKEYSQHYPNIRFKGYIKNKEEIAKEFGKHEYFILNSKRNEKWEELFGMVLIESMSQGVVPIATNHTGPSEIINNKIGYLYKEGALANTIENVIEDRKRWNELSQSSKEESLKFLPENLTVRWSSILN